MNFDLKNKTALVCGSTQGIGKAIAEGLATFGASVVLVARNADSLTQTQKSLPVSPTQKHSFLSVDFTNPESLRTIIENFIKSSNPVHILVNNTGGPAGGPIADATADQFLKTFEQHLICNHILTQAILPGMKSEKYGRIINIISTSVKQPIKGLGVSNTIRAAVANWAKTLSVEVAPFGITVNNILPGATLTKRLTTLIENKAKQSGRSVDDIQKEMMSEIPAGRFAIPDEIAAAAVFLALPSSGYINGVNLPVDGGRTGSL